MPGPYTQANRSLTISTPLGKDVLIITGFTGREAISELYNFQLDCVAENKTEVAFDKLLGQKLTIHLALPNKKLRHFNGICHRVKQKQRDDFFTYYRLEIAPQLWLLTRRHQSRIFQHVTVPDILKKVLEGLDATYEIQGTFAQRDFCVQYRESDFDFASRLMEEEGIFYFFKHAADGHKLIVANTPQSHPDVPEFPKAIYEEIKGGFREDLRIVKWEKTQEIRSGKVTLWDHNFELPGKHLEADKTIQESVAIGKVTHKLKVANNDKLEIYDYPGEYAERVDGIDRGGAAKPAELQKIFEDNKRTVGIRMQEEAVQSLVIEGESNCGQFTSGHKFALERHFNADGTYVLVSVEHTGSLPLELRSGQGSSLAYQNQFTCIPIALPFRPLRKTPKPEIAGTQTAVVVGPPGEQIFCDKYGRVKVQFHWDREGKLNADSSCWIRVNNPWGGKGWGGNFLPHVGQEVIVGFEEGDVDRPVILGRVYNAEMMPPLTLPGHKTKSIIRDHGGNQIFMEGQPGAECIVMNSPCGQTSLSMGYVPAQITPTGSGWGVVERMKDLIPFLNQGPSFSMFSAGNWNSKFDGNCQDHVEGDRDAYTGGKNRSLTKGPMWCEVRNNYDTLVTGNYTCRVNGYQEYSTLGDYTTNVFGKNFVTIVGFNNNKMLAVQVNLVAGAKLEYDLTKDLKKTPTYQLITSKEYRYAVKHCTKAVRLNEIAEIVEKKATNADYSASAQFKFKAASIRQDATNHLTKATNILMKGGKLDVNAATALKKKFKTLNIKDDG